MSRPNGLTFRARALGASLSAPLAALLVMPCLSGACVDPKQDYDDWIARTADARATVYVPPDSAAFEGSPPDGGFAGTFFMACLPSTSLGDVGQALLSKVVLQYTADGNGGGTVDYRAIALRIGSTDLSQSVGTPTILNGVRVTSFVAPLVYGPTTIPATADPLTPLDIIFQDLTLFMHIEDDTHLCATLSGHLVQPEVIDLSQPGSNCVLRPSSGPIPKLVTDDFHCP